MSSSEPQVPPLSPNMGLNKKLKGLLGSDTSSNQSPRPLLGHPRYNLVEEDVHDDNDLIFPEDFPWNDLIPGCANLDPNTKNPRLDKNYTKGHHGAANHGKKKSDFKKFRFGFCLEYCRDENGTEYRCLNQFQIHSTQCKDHPKAQYKDGPNKIWTEMAANRVGNWGMINKVQSEPAETTPTTDSFDVPPWHEIHAEAEERVALFGEDSQTAWTNALARYNQKKAIVVKTNKQTAREQARKDSAPLGESIVPKSRN